MKKKKNIFIVMDQFMTAYGNLQKEKEGLPQVTIGILPSFDEYGPGFLASMPEAKESFNIVLASKSTAAHIEARIIPPYETGKKEAMQHTFLEVLLGPEYAGLALAFTKWKAVKEIPTGINIRGLEHHVCAGSLYTPHLILPQDFSGFFFEGNDKVILLDEKGEPLSTVDSDKKKEKIDVAWQLTKMKLLNIAN